ncbi:peroxisomal membrane protein PEX14 [Tanacetum coccineum]
MLPPVNRTRGTLAVAPYQSTIFISMKTFSNTFKASTFDNSEPQCKTCTPLRGDSFSTRVESVWIDSYIWKIKRSAVNYSTYVLLEDNRPSTPEHLLVVDSASETIYKLNRSSYASSCSSDYPLIKYDNLLMQMEMVVVYLHNQYLLVNSKFIVTTTYYCRTFCYTTPPKILHGYHVDDSKRQDLPPNPDQRVSNPRLASKPKPWEAAQSHDHVDDSKRQDLPPNPDQRVSNPRLAPKPKPWEAAQSQCIIPTVKIMFPGPLPSISPMASTYWWQDKCCLSDEKEEVCKQEHDEKVVSKEVLEDEMELKEYSDTERHKEKIHVISFMMFVRWK